VTRLSVATVLVLLGGVPSGAAAQSIVRLEAGLGVGKVGEGGGLNGRLAGGLLVGRWGGMVRITAHTGGEGTSEPGFAGAVVSALYGPPVESFYEAGLLLTRSLAPDRPHRILLSVGLGALWGRRIDPADSVGLADLERTWGIPVELALYGGDGRGWGVGILLSGHINSESPQFGIVTSINFGL
jgi:hypothetical protein